MHYAIIALGSRGDVQPFIALSIGLMTRSHTVTLIAHENFKEFIEGYGVPFHQLTGNIEAYLHTEDGRKLLASGSTIALMRYLNKGARQWKVENQLEILCGCRGADAIVTSILGIPIVSCVAELYQKPWAVVELSFPTTETGAAPFEGVAFLNIPWVNRLGYRVLHRLSWRMTRKEVNTFRTSLGLPRANKWPNVLRLHAISPQLIPQPPDWDSLAKITGFMTLPIAPQPPAEEVQKWMAEGEAPVYVGLGSIPAPHPQNFEKSIMALLGEFRVLYCKGWSAMALSPHPNLCIVDKIDHRWLFPRCRAAVIHGGVGTMAAALGAGTPPIILSVFADQPWWGRMVERRGLGVHIPFKRLTPERLLNAVRQVGKIKPLRDENGVEQAIAALEDYLPKFRSASLLQS